MSDDVKDFCYYADKAEQYIADSFLEEDDPNQRFRYIARAEVYATLAAGAPAGRSSGVCPGRLFPVPQNGDFKICVLGDGHSGDHLTGGGVYFRD